MDFQATEVYTSVERLRALYSNLDYINGFDQRVARQQLCKQSNTQQ
jgi:hypothetical protein